MFLKELLAFASSNTIHATWTVWISNFLFVLSNAFNKFSFPVDSLSVVIATFPFIIFTFLTSSCDLIVELFLKSATERFFVPPVIELNFTVVKLSLVGNFQDWFMSQPSINPKPSGI